MAAFFVVVALLLAVWAIRKLDVLLRRSQNPLPFPPGPRPKPLIGNMLDFPSIHTPQVFAEWSKKYNSPIVYAESLGNRVVVINSFQYASELFEQPGKARIYSDRPKIPIIKLMDWDYNLAILPYGDWWRQHRKVCQQNFNAQAAQKYESIQTKKIKHLLQGLLETPRDFDSHNKMFSMGLTVAMMYGYDVKSIDDPLVTIADEAVMLGAKLLAPGASLINVVPLLQHIPSWFPGASSHKLIAEVKRMTHEVKKIPIDFIKKCFEEGTAVHSLVTDFYEKKITTGASLEEEEIINNVALTVYGAASDTTISATGTFFYTMAINPGVQKKAQNELDRVVGSTRLPTLGDRQALPYIEAIYREVMRFNPPIPLSVPHSASEDDHYRGYLIPKGATILPNIWAMTHDEEVYPDPFTFKPERFLDHDGNLNDDDRILAYGFGRRICVGRHVADTTMWMVIASVLACFNIMAAKDEDGNPIEITSGYEDGGLISKKSKFECTFSVRSREARLLIVEHDEPGSEVD